MKGLVLPTVLLFAWDKGNLEHIKKHKVEYDECEEIFFDEPIFFYDGKHSETEDRYLAYGVTDEQRFVSLVFTLRNGKIRVIAARDQNKKEKLTYAKNTKK